MFYQLQSYTKQRKKNIEKEKKKKTGERKLTIIPKGQRTEKTIVFQTRLIGFEIHIM
jgi:hypothetical protein